MLMYCVFVFVFDGLICVCTDIMLVVCVVDVCCWL